METLHSNEENNALSSLQRHRAFNIHKLPVSGRCAGCPLIAAIKNAASPNEPKK